MGRIVVNVMPTADALGAEGERATARAAELGYGEFVRVRQGRRFLLTVEGEITEAHLARARELGDHLAEDGFEVIAVYAQGQTIVVGDDDEWDVYSEGIGAVAPIPEGAGRHEGRRWTHHEVALEQHVEGYGTGVYTGEDD